jgi:hypothetical protein
MLGSSEYRMGSARRTSAPLFDRTTPFFRQSVAHGQWPRSVLSYLPKGPIEAKSTEAQ